jgi:hypothetical protein
MKRTFLAAAALAVLGLAWACGSNYKKSNQAEISIAVAGDVGKVDYTFNNVEPGKSATVELSIENLGKADLSITGFRAGDTNTQSGGVLSDGLFRLTNDVADPASIVVSLDGEECDPQDWAYHGENNTIEFVAGGDCVPTPELTQVSVTYKMVPNPRFTLDFKGKAEPTAEAPFTLVPKFDAEGHPSYKSFDFAVKFSPTSTPEPGDYVLLVLSDDPTYPEKVITFHVSTPVPEVDVYPPSKKFLNAQYECQDFEISNHGNADLVFLGVKLEKQSNRFEVKDWPNQGDVVAPGGEPLSFKVCYTPIDNEPEVNLVSVATNDPITPEFKVSIRCQPVGGELKVSYATMETLGYVDFTGVTQGYGQETVIVQALTAAECTEIGKVCGGPVKLMDLNVNPEAAREAYSWKMQKSVGGGSYQDVTNSAVKDQLIASQKFLYSVPAGQSVEIIITYNSDFSAQGNGTLDLDYATPVTGTYSLNLFGGEPKSRFDLAPANDQLHFDISAAEAKTLSAVVYNNGNAALVVKGVAVKGKWTETSTDFVLADAGQAAGFQVPPFSLVEIPVTFQYASGEPTPTGKLDLVYEDAGVGDVARTLWLYGHPDLGLVLPQAKPVAPVNAVAGATVEMDGTTSTATPGSDIAEFVWFLTAKPEGSKASLNVIKASNDSGGRAAFVPDKPGQYEVVLIVYNMVDNQAVFSDPASVTFTAAASR